MHSFKIVTVISDAFVTVAHLVSKAVSPRLSGNGAHFCRHCILQSVQITKSPSSHPPFDGWKQKKITG